MKDWTYEDHHDAAEVHRTEQDKHSKSADEEDQAWAKGHASFAKRHVEMAEKIAGFVERAGLVKPTAAPSASKPKMSKREAKAKARTPEARAERIKQGGADFGLPKPNVKKADGEGSRGGRVIGHTKSGKAVYAPSKDRVERMREHVNLQKKTAGGKLDEHANAHVNLHRATKDANYDSADHKDAAEKHEGEAKNYSNSDKERALHSHIANAHHELSEGRKTPHVQNEERKNKAAASKEATRLRKERNRKTDTVATTATGHAIQNTHHVRFGGFGPELKEGPASDSHQNKFAKKEWAPIETELGEHLTPEQNKDIAVHHRAQASLHSESARHHSQMHSNERRTGNYDNTTNHFEEFQKHRNASMNHTFAANEHEAQARGVGHIDRVAKDAEEEKTPSGAKRAEELHAQARTIRQHADKPVIGNSNGKPIYGFKEGSAFHNAAAKLRESNEGYAELHDKMTAAAHEHAHTHHGFDREDHLNAAKAHEEIEKNPNSSPAQKDGHAILKRAHQEIAEKTKLVNKAMTPQVRRIS